ncbi:MAG TPA: hypothetical protein VM266_08195 [Solirubrobacteraceae bacterium]|nr:hypothetical protein [Solirubrobacteraceae bacterium]
MARRVVTIVAFLLWGLLMFLTLFVLFTSGPDVLVLVSLLVLAVLGAGVFGALGDRDGR